MEQNKTLSGNWIAQILPINSSQDAEGYTYRIPENLVAQIREGQLVAIPLRDDMDEGIVAQMVQVSSGATVSEDIKEIDKILEISPIFTHEQLRKMLAYATHHAIHIHKVVSFFLPAPVRKRILKYGLVSPEETLREEELTPSELVHFLSAENCLVDAAKLLLQDGVVVIAPSDIYVEKILAHLSVQSETLGIFYSQMTDTLRAKFWIDTFSRKYTSVIGTRRLVTYNLKQFHTIVFMEDSLFRELLHSFHRYNVLDILSGSLSSDQKLLIYSSTPSVESMSLALVGKINFSTRS